MQQHFPKDAFEVGMYPLPTRAIAKRENVAVIYFVNDHPPPPVALPRPLTQILRPSTSHKPLARLCLRRPKRAAVKTDTSGNFLAIASHGRRRPIASPLKPVCAAP